MHNKAFSKLLEQLKNLTPSQKDKLESNLHISSESEKVSVVIDTGESCPYCNSKSYKKVGCTFRVCNVIVVSNVIKHIMLSLVHH